MGQRIVVVTIIALAGVTTARAAGPVPKTDEEKTIYAIGVALGRNVVAFDLTPAEFALVRAGFADGASNKEPKVDLETFGPKTNELWQARVAKTAEAEKKNAQAFLERAAAEKGAEKKPSGLIYTELKAGDGQQPKPTDKVKVHYTGTLRDGTVFDSSIRRGKPADLPLHAATPCWAEGLQLMREHGKAKIVCPSDLAYGDRGAPPKIKPGAALAFEVELLEVSPGGMGGDEVPGAAEPKPGAEGSGKEE
jgi:FKBP-type peptidyl-prolyl cis-trans isomerase FkpA